MANTNKIRTALQALLVDGYTGTAAQHAYVCHGDGSPCLDGCDAAADPRALSRLEVAAYQLDSWLEARRRQAAQHPADHLLSISRGDHYRRKNNGVALRTFRMTFRGVCGPSIRDLGIHREVYL